MGRVSICIQLGSLRERHQLHRGMQGTASAENGFRDFCSSSMACSASIKLSFGEVKNSQRNTV